MYKVKTYFITNMIAKYNILSFSAQILVHIDDTLKKGEIWKLFLGAYLTKGDFYFLISEKNTLPLFSI